eukprot:TRINITY_DN1226_c0_g1_i1.p1 TRINITY_DN1226_c0_g1~~TRINITY_DN1226_c0_g1_i1.p1  ORF type:complete len:383 (-),score=45.80 TRINITY_DN1226_c0_g1_i1:22-1170(-)
MGWSLLTTIVVILVFHLGSSESLISPRLDVVKSIYNLTIWPYNDYILHTLYPSKVPRPQNYVPTYIPDVFTANASGRVYAFRTFDGPAGIAEYFYALTPSVSTFVLPGELTTQIYDVEVREYFEFPICDGNKIVEYRAMSITDYVITPFNSSTPRLSNASQWSIWRFTPDNKVIEFNNVQPYYSKSLREGLSRAYIGGFHNETYQLRVIDQTCELHTRYCLGSNMQYTNKTDCVDFLRKMRDNYAFGEPDVEVGNNVICRRRHATLTVVNPDTHCVHVGPSGGGQCIDTPTSDLYVPYAPFVSDPYRISGGFPVDSVRGQSTTRLHTPDFTRYGCQFQGHHNDDDRRPTRHHHHHHHSDDSDRDNDSHRKHRNDDDDDHDDD